MEINSGNKKRIDEYIVSHPESIIDRKLRLILQGERKDLPVYRLPLDLLFYNLKNGRFAAEYKELVLREGGELQVENKDDAEKIKKLLLNLDKHTTEVTKQDIIKRGQWNDALITDDGYVIDGNRRLSILSELSESGDDKWNYINVARLPSSVDPKDLWKIEAGVQLGKEEIARYGPINELLKFKEGVDSGLTIPEISKTLYGFEDKAEEIEKKLELLKLIEEYLKFIGKPSKYLVANGKVEHFIDLQKYILTSAKKNGLNLIEQTQIKNVAFDLIAHSKLSHLRLRRMHKMISLSDASEKLFEASKYAVPTEPDKAAELDSKAETLEDLVNKTVDPDLDETEEETESNPVLTFFINAEDTLRANENKDKVQELLNAAKSNLSYIPMQSPDLKKKELQEVIRQIVRYAEKLRPFIE